MTAPPGDEESSATAGTPDNPHEQFPIVAVGRGEDSYRRVRLFYATDRRREPRDGKLWYGDAQREDSAEDKAAGRGVEYGFVDVAIPWKHHRVGTTDDPSWYSLRRNDPSRFSMVVNLNALGQDSFVVSLREAIDASSSREVLVFVHGYNNSFDEAVWRTAQIAYDLDFNGVPVVFDWASKGRTLDYVGDGYAATRSVPRMRAFLELLARQQTASSIYLIAHSMGSRVLCSGLAQVQAAGTIPPDRPRFSALVLAAPDISVQTFEEDIRPFVSHVTERRTIYTSAKDRALKASNVLGSDRMLGQGGDQMRVFDGYDTVDCTCVCDGFFNHSYFAEHPRLLADITGFMLRGAAAVERGLFERSTSFGKYWSLCDP